MFNFLFKYGLITTLREKNVVFWLICFPFFLATIFGVVLHDLGKSEPINPIPIHVEDNQYKVIMEKFRYEGKPIFKLKNVKDPKQALKEGQIKAYIYSSPISNSSYSLNKPSVKVFDEDTDTGIVYNTVNNIYHSHLSIEELMKYPANHEKLNEMIAFLATKNIPLTNGRDMNGKNMTVTFFYALLAMICLGTSSFGINIVEHLNPHSELSFSKRLGIVPIGKMKLITPIFCSNILISIVTSFILFFYIRNILGVEFGGHTWQIILGIILGNIMAMSMGIVFALAIRGSVDMKYTITSSFYVFSCFLAGMMVSHIPALITNYAPAINYINPATVLTRMFTSLYLYNDIAMYMLGILNVIIITFALLIVAKLLARRNTNA